MKLSSLQKGLVGSWNLDQQSFNPSSKRFTDSTPYSNHGTGQGTQLGSASPGFQADQMGQLAKAAPFNGTDDCIDCGNDESLDIVEAITISAWIKPNGHQDDYNRLVDKSSPYGFAFDAMENDKLRFYAEFGGLAQGFDSVGTYTINIWNHVLVKYDGISGEFFINGVSAGTFTPSPAGDLSVTVADLFIGAKKVVYFFDGSIADVRIYNRTILPVEVTMLHELYNPRIVI